MNIVIIDYGMGNLRSVYNKCKRVGFSVLISNNKNDIVQADKLILPGVGHFANGMQKLAKLELLDVLNQKVINEKTPILGICLGMQLFCKFSEEGNVNGLGWIDADVVKFSTDNKRFKIPHMGWNNIIPCKESFLLNEFNTDHLFYFVHSYYVRCNNQSDVLTTTEYNTEFVSSIQRDNITGVQFHPEKSHEWGELLMKNFLEQTHV